MPRVIAGKYRGLRLETPKGERTRPTVDRAKEALFSAIGFAITDATFLDLYAGSGQIGVEALSRGALEVIFSEADKKAFAVLQSNLQKLRLSDNLSYFKPAATLVNAGAVRDRQITKKALAEASPEVILYHGQAANLCKQLVSADKHFDFIYFDPPWSKIQTELLALAPYLEKLMGPKSYFICEMPYESNSQQISVPKFILQKSYHYGMEKLCFMQLPENEAI